MDMKAIKRTFLSLYLVSFVSLSSYALTEKLYVSPDGTGSKCTQTNPCDIYTAFDKSGLDGIDTEIYLSGGIYKLNKDLKFEPANISGNLGGKTSIKNSDGKEIVIDGNNNSFSIVIDNKTNLEIFGGIVFKNFYKIGISLKKGANINILETIFQDIRDLSISGNGNIQLNGNTFIYSKNYNDFAYLSFDTYSGYSLSVENNLFISKTPKAKLNIYFGANKIDLKKNMFKDITFNNNYGNSIEVFTNRLNMQNNVFANLKAGAIVDKYRDTFPYLITIKPLDNNDYILFIWNNTFYKNQRIFDITPNKGFLIHIANTRKKINGSLVKIDNSFNQKIHLHNNIFEKNKTLGCSIAKDVLGDFDISSQSVVFFYDQGNIFSDCKTGEEDKCVMANVNLSPHNLNYWNTAAEMVDPDNGNFALTKNSFAVDKGYGGNTDLYPPTEDYFGNPRVKPLDIGAVEYQENYDLFASIDIKGSGFGYLLGSNSVGTETFVIFPGKEIFNSIDNLKFSRLYLKAEPDMYSKFVRWEGDCSSCNNNINCDIALPKDKNIHCVAVFDKELYTLKIEKDTPHGSVFIDRFAQECSFSKNGNKYTCKVESEKNSYITLYVLSSSYLTEDGIVTFDSWQGDCSDCGSNTSCPILLNKDINCFVKFSSYNPNVGQLKDNPADNYQTFNPNDVQTNTNDNDSGCSMGTGNSIFLSMIVLFILLVRRRLLNN